MGESIGDMEDFIEAMRREHTELSEFCDGKNNINKQYRGGMTPFQCACFCGDKDPVLELILKGAKIDDPRGHVGKQPMTYAILARNTGPLKVLLACGASLENKRTGWNALQLAAESKQLDSLRLLMASGRAFPNHEVMRTAPD